MELPEIREEIPLAPFTTMRVGGNARFFAEPSSQIEIQNCRLWAKNKNLPVYILGYGSNLIVSDTGFPGLVIRLNGRFSQITWKNNFVVAEAGLPLETLVDASVERNFQGMEKLAGIPGSIGGAVFMNAGAFGQNTCDRLSWVETLDTEGNVRRWIRSEMEFGYRKSPFQKSGELIVRTGFEFESGENNLLELERINTRERRHAKQPWESCCAGSVFRRPEGYFAGALIEQAALKGKQVGHAKVSEKHAGFIINQGNATAAEVMELICLVQQEVKKKSGILLETEVMFLGNFPGIPQAV